MKIGLSFVTLTSAAVLALGASAAQARVEVNEGQATTAQTQAAKKAALWYQAEANLFNKLKRYQTRHQTMGWSGPLPF
jgi:flagellar basal body-associated protein FliL